ncbi:MAG: hypothetical protein JWM98_1812 [Thermoleophilia bacterium]|nr:hypothetical protein [Thermoleophilia bacterium]
MAHYSLNGLRYTATQQPNGSVQIQTHQDASMKLLTSAVIPPEALPTIVGVLTDAKAAAAATVEREAAEAAIDLVERAVEQGDAKPVPAEAQSSPVASLPERPADGATVTHIVDGAKDRPAGAPRRARPAPTKAK